MGTFRTDLERDEFKYNPFDKHITKEMLDVTAELGSNDVEVNDYEIGAINW